MNYELICGLETHIELATDTKIFCSCRPKFGAEPNTTCCPVCVGMPGTLPVLNEKVIKYAIMMGLAFGCEINLNSIMERKNYVYPDLPKAYQISQNSAPICIGGEVVLPNNRKIRIHHIHIEEDAGKIINKNGSIFVDYNRGGTPLIEIVSEPDIRSPEEAKEYIEKLQQTAKYLKISDGRMQEGSLRCDVNVSVRKIGDENFGTRVEIKNMNSITFIVNAIDYEFKRQVEILAEGKKIAQETRRYEEKLNQTQGMREKENVTNYRYFAEPDIRKVNLNKEFVEGIQRELPELPDLRIKRYKTLGISSKSAELIARYVRISDFLDETLKKCKNPNIAANFIIGTIFSHLNTEADKEEFKIPLNSNEFCYLIDLISKNEIDQNNAKQILIKSLEKKGSLKQLCDEFTKIKIDFDISSICEEAMSLNKQAILDYKNGTEKAFQAILGTVMKLTHGKANAEEAKKIVQEKIKNDKIFI
ncbi:MAG: Asp-tRNA(Asn)/Glu-tRNA(Gln) amidotransferase subunit GatB [Oscillospiraceae bacterium]|jgi:aspartyl-tRNA(Asn)/glutamyl-tRNA(Gln) amidotransferase subunit B|nr:Asp-tRNA(Asn)/Glu-tRNA(Gln) amidotransferase subunit GatB [Oscillospiraceae bacterium]